MGYHLVSVNQLFEITCRKQLSLQSTQRQKTVDRSLRIAYGYGFGRQGLALEQQNRNEQPAANPCQKSVVRDRSSCVIVLTAVFSLGANCRAW